MWKQLPYLTGPLRRQPGQHILEVGIRIIPIHARRLDPAYDCRARLRTGTT